MIKFILVVAILVGVAQGTLIIKPPKPVEPTTKCQIYWREYAWALEDCVCRIFQNACLLNAESNQREKAGKTRKMFLLIIGFFVIFIYFQLSSRYRRTYARSSSLPSAISLDGLWWLSSRFRLLADAMASREVSKPKSLGVSANY